MDPRIDLPDDTGPLVDQMILNCPVANIRAAGRPSAAKQTEILFGQSFNVYRQQRGWSWGQAVSPVSGSSQPGYIGYVRSRNLSPNIEKVSHIVSALSAPVFSRPDIKSRIVMSLPLGACLAGRVEGEFITVSNGYVHHRHVRMSDEYRSEDFVSIAERFLGQPYIWGGISSFGLDCSGLVQSSLRAIGQDVPRDSDQQAGLGQALPISQKPKNLARGDLIFWKGHVGIMQSGTQLLHANAFHMCVASEPLQTAIVRIEKSAGPITGIRRL